MLYVFILVIISSGSAMADGIEEGNSFLKQKKYEDASKSYEKIILEGYISHDLFYNLGIAYLNQNKRYKAVLNFEKALRLKPMDASTHMRIVQVNMNLSDKPPIYEDTGFLAFINKVQFALPIDAWAVLSIFMMLLVAGCIFVSYKFPVLKGKKIIFVSSGLWLVLSVLCIILARNSYHYKYLSNEAIVSGESIRVYDKSDVNSSILFNLHEGTKVDIVDEENGMYHVEFAEKSGWISTKDVEKIAL